MKGIITLLISSILCGICGWKAAKERRIKFLVLAIFSKCLYSENIEIFNLFNAKSNLYSYSNMFQTLFFFAFTQSI